MFSVKALRVSVRFRHNFRECSGVTSETSGDDISGQLIPGADQDTQIQSLPSELASFVTETKVESVTHKVPVSKERLRNRFQDIEL